jgi:FkbH-like protein
MHTETSLLDHVRAFVRGEETHLDRRAVRELADSQEVPAARLEKLGHLLGRLPDDRRGSVGVPIRIGVVSNFTCDPIADLLRTLLVAEEIWPEMYLGDYNQFVGELMDSTSGLNRFAPRVTVCLLDEHFVFDGVSRAWNAADLQPILDERAQLVESLAARHSQAGSGILVLNTIPLSRDRHDAVISYRGKAELSQAWRQFNAQLLSASVRHDTVLVVDTDLVLQRLTADFRDPRLMHHAGMYMSLECLCAIGREIVSVVRAALGKTKKCLVLDLDNTLWGGVVAEDGVTGIALGGDVAGRPYVAFQETARALKEQGVLLAINSKNDSEVAGDAFKHPDMVLREDDFVKATINWRPKSDNLKELAASLNLGLDSFVFFDDERFERNLVKDQLPGVAVLDVPSDPSYYTRTLLANGWFTTMATTQEDLARTVAYRQQVQRDDLLNGAASFEDYLESLGITVNFVAPTEFNLPRLTQLNLRTNQFNMTTRRFQTGDMQSMAASPHFAILGVEASDKFGGYGLIGSVIVEKCQDSAHARWHIRNFLLSCRVLGRGIEVSVLRHVLAEAKRCGADFVRADYVPSAKNGKFKDFYSSNGFSLEAAGDETVIFRHDLETLDGDVPWIFITSCDGAQPS